MKKIVALLTTTLIAATCVHGQIVSRYTDNEKSYYVVQVSKADADKTSKTMRVTSTHKPKVVLCVTDD